MRTLAGRVAVVTGASRGVGRGVAAGLGEAGATVYLSGRTAEDLEAAAGEVTELGGHGVPVPCDHRNDEQVEALFRRVRGEQGRIDVLVNSAWGGYEHMVQDGVFTWPNPFWEQPRWRWDAMFQAGVRAAYVASALAAADMVRARSGLIVHVSSRAARTHEGNAAYGTAKAATDKLAADMAAELREHGVTAVSLYPGLVRTEAVLASGAFDLSDSESPRFVGRAVAAMAADPHVLARSGQVVVTAELARAYGFTEVG